MAGIGEATEIGWHMQLTPSLLGLDPRRIHQQNKLAIPTQQRGTAQMRIDIDSEGRA